MDRPRDRQVAVCDEVDRLGASCQNTGKRKKRGGEAESERGEATKRTQPYLKMNFNFNFMSPRYDLLGRAII